jgi:hypothetical protein
MSLPTLCGRQRLCLIQQLRALLLLWIAQMELNDCFRLENYLTTDDPNLKIVFIVNI